MAIKKCIVCGAEFSAHPSSKKITCSAACSKTHKVQVHTGKPHPWGEEAKSRLKAKGRTENLTLGTDAAKVSPRSGRYDTNVNALTWVLESPLGERVEVKNLLKWSRENCVAFGKEPTDHNARIIASGFRNIKQSRLGRLRRPKTRQPYSVNQYKGWLLISWSKEE